MEISCNPANPVNYLACCGIFDLLSRIDSKARACWRIEPSVAFQLESEISEEDLLYVILDTFSTPNRWVPQRPDPTGEATWFKVNFQPSKKTAFDVALDWWLETAELDGSIASNTAWKMFAGRQTVERILLLNHKDEDKRGMVRQCESLRMVEKLPTSVKELFESELPMTSRFGYDPRSSRNALDVGWSPNDLNVPISTAIFAEMLALFGVNSFFPSRTDQAGRLNSTRGWHAVDRDRPPTFTFSLWKRPLPVALARRAAGAGDLVLLSIRDDSRGKYKNLTLAKPTEPKTNP